MPTWIVTTFKTQRFNQLIEADDQQKALEVAQSNHYDGRNGLKDDMQHTATPATDGQINGYADMIIRSDTIKLEA